MPRHARNLVNSGFYHIMIRGVNKQIIFNNDEDRMFFLRLMNYYKKKWKCKIHAYCLMDNHVHILFEDKEFLISDFMRDITSHYAIEFNKKYKRVGHLYQERFKSVVVYNEGYLLRLIRYIHRNPEEAGICKTEDYKWSSYREYINNSIVIDKSYILSKFEYPKKCNIENFKDFILNKDEDDIDKIYCSVNLTDEQAEKLLKHIINMDDISCFKDFTKEKKKEILQKLLDMQKMSNAQIARILGISKNFRINLNLK